MSKVANRSASDKIEAFVSGLRFWETDQNKGELTNFRIAPNLVVYGVTCKKFTDENQSDENTVEDTYDLMDTEYPFTNKWVPAQECRKISYNKTKNLEVVKSLDQIVSLSNKYFLIKSGTDFPTYYVCSMRYKIVSQFTFDKVNETKDIVISVFDNIEDIDLNKFRNNNKKYNLKENKLRDSNDNSRLEISSEKFGMIDTFIEGMLSGFMLSSIVLFMMNLLFTSLVCICISITFIYTYAYINTNKDSIINDSKGIEIEPFNNNHINIKPNSF